MTEQTELEYEADQCAEYIMQKLADGDPLTEENLAMWIVDHFTAIVE